LDNSRTKPSIIYKHHHQQKPNKPTAQARLRLEPTHRSQHTQALCGVALTFFVMVFVSQHTCSTFIFLKDRKKIKELQPTPRTKTHAKKR
jgi:hypothetical protein